MPFSALYVVKMIRESLLYTEWISNYSCKIVGKFNTLDLYIEYILEITWKKFASFSEIRKVTMNLLSQEAEKSSAQNWQL